MYPATVPQPGSPEAQAALLRLKLTDMAGASAPPPPPQKKKEKQRLQSLQLFCLVLTANLQRSPLALSAHYDRASSTCCDQSAEHIRAHFE